jgi:hypothetical protein
MELAFFVSGEHTANSASWNGLGRWYSELAEGRMQIGQLVVGQGREVDGVSLAEVIDRN